MWAQALNALLGMWLMAAPFALGYAGAARVNDRVVGPIAAGCALLALHTATRPLRSVNLVLGLWLLLAPWVLGAALAPLVNSMAIGFLLIGCALVRGTPRHRLDGGWSALWATNSPHRP